MNYNVLKKNHQVKKYINRFKTISDKIIKVKSAITFLIRCRNAGIIPRFIRSSTKNVSNIFDGKNFPKIENTISRYTEDLNNKILRLTITEKHELLKHFQSEEKVISRNLERYLTVKEMEEFVRYEQILRSSFRRKINDIHRKKFDRLYELHKKELGIKFNRKWFVNKTDLDIPTDVQWILSLGHKHALPVKKDDFPTLKFIADGEDLIQTLQCKEKQEIARTQFTTVIDNHLNKMRFTNRDRFVLNKVQEAEKFLKTNKNILILKADKGNATVAIKKQDYDIRMNNIVMDESKYQLVNKDPTNRLQKENNGIIEELYKLQIITTIERQKLKTNVAIAPRLYGLPKIHKKDFPVRPICSFVNSPSYGLCQYITNILKKITENSLYNVKDSLQFKCRLIDHQIRDDERLVSLDVISLFPSIPIDLAISTIEEKWDMIKGYTRIEKYQFLRILKFCIEDNRYFQYNNKIYLQRKGLPMGSPASPIVADIVMEKLINDCIEKLSTKPKIMTKYVDDIFCIIPKCAIDNLLTTFNEFHPSIKFTLEEECNSKLPFLDTLVIRSDKRLLIDWYQKPTASGRIINYYSKHSKNIIINTASNLVHRILTISDNEFHIKNKEIIRNILTDNNFPIKLTNRLITHHDDQKRNKIVNTVDPMIYKSITYLPHISERLNKLEIFDKDKYKMAYRTYNTLNRLFSKTKDRIQKLEMSNIVYKIPCNGNDNVICDKVYVGTTKNKLKIRISGHKSDQKYRNYNTSQKTALSSHCAKLNHYPDFENVSVLNTENNYKRRFMLEMLQIINIPANQRINFKADIEGVAQSYRHLVNK